MGGPKLAARERHHDLAGMEMTREDQVERAGGDPPDDSGEVAEEDSQVRLGSESCSDSASRRA